MSTLTHVHAEHEVEAKATCSFCVGLSGHSASKADAPVVANDAFVAWVSVGALADGHLLVIPRHHVLSLRSLSPREKVSLGAFVEKAREILTSNYGPVCL